MIRRHSGSATEPSAFVGSPSSTMRVHALGVAVGEGARHADDDAGLVHRRRAVDRHQLAVVVEVVLDELAARDAARAVARAPGASTLTSSAGCTEPRRRACTIRRAPSSSGCSGRVAGSSISTITPRPAGANSRSSRSRSSPPRAVAHAAADDHGLDAEALGLAGVAVDQRARLLRREVDVRPHVQPHAVPQQPLARRAARLEAPQRAQRLGQHVLELGQRDDAARARRARRSARAPRRARTAARPSGSSARRRGTGRRRPGDGIRSSANSDMRHRFSRSAISGCTNCRSRSISQPPSSPRRSVIASAAGDAALGRGHVEHDALHEQRDVRALERSARASSASSSPAVAAA